MVHAGVTRQTGVLGVESFFVISGFLITWKLLEELEATGNVSLKGFYWRRVLRIFPAYYCFGFLAVGQILIRTGDVRWPDAIAAFFYVSNYYHGLSTSTTPFLLHTWSLSVEEQFYLLWPTLFIALRKQLPRLMRVLIVLILCVWIGRALLSLLGPDWVQWYIYTAFEMHMDQLAVGCLVAIALRRRLWLPFWKAICASPFAPLATAGLLAASEQFVDNVKYRNIVSYATDPLLCAIFLVQAIALSQTVLWRWLDSPVLNWIGKLSYSIYLYHELAIGVARRLAGEQPYLGFAISLSLTLGLASASFYLVERPVLKLKRKLPFGKP